MRGRKVCATPVSKQLSTLKEEEEGMYNPLSKQLLTLKEANKGIYPSLSKQLSTLTKEEEGIYHPQQEVILLLFCPLPVSPEGALWFALCAYFFMKHG